MRWPKRGEGDGEISSARCRWASELVSPCDERFLSVVTCVAVTASRDNKDAKTLKAEWRGGRVRVSVGSSRCPHMAESKENNGPNDTFCMLAFGGS